MIRTPNTGLTIISVVLAFFTLATMSCQPHSTSARSQAESGKSWVTVEPLDSEGFVRVSIVNRSERSIEVYDADLPWRHPDAMIVVLVQNELPYQCRSVSDHLLQIPPGSTVLGPGEAIEGTLNVLDRFGALGDIAKGSGRLLALWRYELNDISGHIIGRWHGGFEMSPRD